MTSKKKREHRWYPRIRNLLGPELNAFAFHEQVKVSGVGIADNVFLVDIGGDYKTDIEVNVIEVKMERTGILEKILQTLKYSLFAHRCYLAVKLGKKENFSFEERYLADALGVGLIKFRREGCAIVNSSKRFVPIKTKMLEAIERLGYVKCDLCENFINIDLEEEYYQANISSFAGWLEKGELAERPIIFSRKRAKRKSFVCQACYEALESVSIDIIKREQKNK